MPKNQKNNTDYSLNRPHLQWRFHRGLYLSVAIKTARIVKTKKSGTVNEIFVATKIEKEIFAAFRRGEN